MRELIQKYLLQHQHVSIEGWGSMSLVHQPAVLDFPNRLIQPPSTVLSFHTSTNGNHDFTDWLADELKIRPEEALQKIQGYVHWFSHTVKEQDVHWNGWGKFSKKGSEVSFSADEVMILPEPLLAERVIRKGAEHQVRVGEVERTSTEMEEWLHAPLAKKNHLWRIIALLMLAAGIILAVLFSSKHNIQWKNNTNYQLLQPKAPPVLYKTP